MDNPCNLFICNAPLLFIRPCNKYIYLMLIKSKFIQNCKDRGITISTSESCTGGMLASEFTSIAGISQIFQSGLITYSNESKRKLLRVSVATLKKYGAVSRQVCAQMCLNLHKISKSQLTFSTTGVAGPTGGTKLKPIGLVYIGIYFKKNIYVEKLIFSPKKSRLQIQKDTVKECFKLANEIINGQ